MSSSIAQSWANTYETYSSRPALLEFWLIQAVQVISFWIPSTILLLIDICFPTWSNSHKIQAERFQPSASQIRHCIQHVLTNSVIGASAACFLAWLKDFKQPTYTITPDLPSLQQMTKDIIFAMFAREILFYSLHRLLHHPRLYKRIHKQHHLFIAPMSFAAQYAHPVEHVFANIVPVMLPLAVRRAHIVTLCVYLGSQLIETSCAHSGYDFFTFPILGTMHDLHHEKFNVNYGGMAWMDWLCGTNRWYRMASGAAPGKSGIDGAVSTLADGIDEKKAK